MNQPVGRRRVDNMILRFGDESERISYFERTNILGTIGVTCYPNSFFKNGLVHKYLKIWKLPKNEVCSGERAILNKIGTPELR